MGLSTPPSRRGPDPPLLSRPLPLPITKQHRSSLSTFLSRTGPGVSDVFPNVGSKGVESDLGQDNSPSLKRLGFLTLIFSRLSSASRSVVCVSSNRKEKGGVPGPSSATGL